jgi:L-ascorbate metabolism protein UlaG (beta-lactamase superfamily)
MRAKACALILAIATSSTACANTSKPDDPIHVDSREKPATSFFSIMWKRFTNTSPHMEPTKPIPVLEPENLEAEPNSDKLVKLGHSTVLIQLDGHWMITDPMFSERASPFSFVGPKRFHQPALALEDLPPISAVLISHDHYDHLDEASIKAIDANTERFLVPSRVERHLIKWGIAPEKITAMEWWQETKIGSVTITTTPSQHFSGRGLNDRNETLWASWAIKGEQHNVFFSGDTGYFKGFKQIGDALGPFDFTLMEAGAYNDMWSNIHLFPEQTLQAHRDLRGKRMIPIHNSTFNLAFHPWFEPLVELDKLAKVEDQMLTPKFGEVIHLDNVKQTEKWWQPLLPWHRGE